MPAEVKVLVEGYTNADTIGETGEERDCPTISLIRDGELVIVVDPGVLEDQQILVDALAKEKLNVHDVNLVVLTHSHIDHYRNIGMFPKAKILEYSGVWERNTVEDWQEQFSSNIQILRTPGHSRTDITLFVITNNGLVAICGDVFWKENYPADPFDDMFATDPEKLKQSRKMVIKMADWIIPGHGPMHKVHDGALEKAEILAARKKNDKPNTVCKKCHRPMKPSEKCLCKSSICYRCCECGLDCDLCSCSHRK